MPKALSEAAKLGGHKVVLKQAAGKGSVEGFAKVTQDQKGDTAATITITEASKPVAQSTPEGGEAGEPSEPALTAADVKQMLGEALTPVQQAVEEKEARITEQSTEIESLKQQLEASKAEAHAAREEVEEKAGEVEAAQEELKTAQQAANAMENLGKLVGSEVTETKAIEVLGTGSQEMRNWQQMLTQSPGKAVMHNNRQFVQKDTRSARDYLLRNQSKIRDGVEAELREAGYLQGMGGTVVTNAPTVMGDIPHTAFDYLSEFVRRPSDTSLIYWQFARNHAVPGTAPRFQGQVPRYPFSPGPTVKADRVLTPGTDIGNDRQAIAEDLVPVTIEELGLGKDANNAPIALSHFVQAFSLTNLENVVQRNLGRDYQQTKDLFVRTEFFGANTVVYNNSNRVVSTPAEVLANGIGCASRGYLRALCASMSTMQIPTFSNGLYVLTLTPNQVQYLLDELATQQRFPEPSSNEIEMISKILQNEDEDYGGMVSGYRFTCDGFMIFQQNVHSTGAAGTPGAQDEAFAPGATLTETCFAIGADSVCWATALPVEIRMDEVTNFGRRDSWIWYSHENSAPLDINEVLNGSGRKTRERRVLQVRLSRDPV